MNNLDTINRGNHIITYDFPDDTPEDYYEIIDFEEEEINYE